MKVILSVRGDAPETETEFVEVIVNGYSYQIRPRRNGQQEETGGLSILALDEPMHIIPSAANKIEIQGTRMRPYPQRKAGTDYTAPKYSQPGHRDRLFKG